MVGYFRVSTAKQGASGLGLDAQKAAVMQHVHANGCDLIGSYVEVETGKKHTLDNRPELQKAIVHAKRSKAILVVAKLDRLLRSTVVRSMLKQSGVKFIACDNPHANEFTIDIMAAVAENEVREIGARTRNALAAKKAKGIPLGSHRPECKDNLSPEAAAKGRLIGAKRARELARELYSDIQDWMIAQRKEGKSLQEIADTLNSEGHTTRRGCPWNPMQVKRVLERAGRNAK